MKKISIFKYLDYRKYLRKYIEKSPDWTQKAVAEAIEVHPPYLTRVLSEDAHLSDDQIYSCLQILQLDSKEETHFLLMHQYQRSGHRERRKVLLESLQKSKESASNASDELNSQIVTNQGAEKFSVLYTDPLLILIYTYIDTGNYRGQVDKICNSLGISLERGNTLLQQLVEIGLVYRDDLTGHFKPSERSLHLDRNSPLMDAAARLQRLNSLEHLNRQSKNKKYSFWSTFSADQETYELIKSDFLQFLKTAQERAQNSKSKEVYQINFDLFDWNLIED